MQELTLKELQKVSLSILLDVHQFCKSRDIKYSIAYGTLIGSLRHKGFIPWDDDVDIMMPRPDYERFLKEYQSDDYCLIYYGNDRTALAGFARVVDCKTTHYQTERPWTIQESGVWIDIFPIDGVESHANDYERRYNRLRRMCNFVYKFRRENHHIRKDDSWWSVIKTYIAKIISLNGIIPAFLTRRMVSGQQSVDYNNAKYLGQCSCLDDGPIQFDRNDFSDYVLLDFEGHKLLSIAGYDHHLRQLYGDYMQLPPEEKRKPKQYWIKFYWKNR